MTNNYSLITRLCTYIHILTGPEHLQLPNYCACENPVR